MTFIRAQALHGITVTDIADHVGYSPFHFQRLFRAAAGLTAGQYLSAVRLDAAKRLLLAGSDPVVDVATAVGFDSLSSFTRRFRTTVGTTPGALRTLADQIAETTLQPTRLADPRQPDVRVHIDLPADVRPGPEISVWIGWFPHPAPIGLPLTGQMSTHDGPLDFPLHPGIPWLLGFASRRHADPSDLLTPEVPAIALHPVPVTGPGEVTLYFQRADQHTLPLLAALPARLLSVEK